MLINSCCHLSISMGVQLRDDSLAKKKKEEELLLLLCQNPLYLLFITSPAVVCPAKINTAGLIHFFSAGCLK